MRYLITGSSGHLGEGLARTLAARGDRFLAVDIKDGPYTNQIGSISDPAFVARSMIGVDVVFHAATLHKPHVVTHSRQDFIDTNVTGTQTLLDAAIRARVSAFIFTSTTSAFGNVLTPQAGAPAVWVTEDLVPKPKNIYGITKLAAENLCELAFVRDRLPCIVLRTSRFFPEEDDSSEMRDAFSMDNAKINELLYRRGDLADMVSAHLLAAQRAGDIGFERFIISATSPFNRGDLAQLVSDAPSVVCRYTDYSSVFIEKNWQMFPSIDRVYVNDKARAMLGWEPEYSFASCIQALNAGRDPFSPLARAVGKKGYHDVEFENGPFPVE